MHPILFEIPLNWITVAVVGLLFGVGAVIRHRFLPADRDASYLATFLGLNVKWGAVQNGWGPSFGQGALTAVIAGGIAAAAKYVAFKQFHTESLPLHIYGLMMATAFMVAIWLGTREASHERMPSVTFTERDGKKVTMTAPDLVSDLSFYILLAGLGGSRVLYIITRWNDEYSHDPGRIFKFWEGGLVWYGGLLAATGVAWWFVRKHKTAFLPYADLLVPGVSLAHGIGRLGCFAAGCCFGNVSIAGFPLSVQFPPGSPAAMAHWGDAGINTLSHPVYPTQLIEASGELLIFTVLLFIRSRKRFHGQVVLSYFFLYAILRTIVEMFRGDAIRGFVFKWPAEGVPMLLSTSQAVSVLTAVGGIITTIVVIRARSKKLEGNAAAVSLGSAAS
jgi:phosphatidylglycerol:prolipoprotein diacylglycerol transferase